MKLFPKKLRAMRIRRRLSQKALADQTSLSQNAISKWERNKSRPDLDVAVKLADALLVDLDYLVNDARTSPELRPEEVIALKMVRSLDLDEGEVIRRLSEKPAADRPHTRPLRHEIAVGDQPPVSPAPPPAPARSDKRRTP